ncbi:5-formyltetrahydrofolate cyclo-ligase [soil metagenome]
MTKADLRASAAALRADAHREAPDAGERLAKVTLAAVSFLEGAVVSAYWPIRSEIDPRPLMRFLVEAGCRVALPLTPPPGVDAPLTFRLWNPEADLTPAAFDLHEPHAASTLVEPDIVLAPLLAFDRTGARLGYGKGHYDRTLTALRSRRPLLAIGLAFAAQEVERVPTEHYDVPLDGIATEIGYIPAMTRQASDQKA